MTARNTLPLFETHPVQRATVKIMKAGDGLSEALKVDPTPLALDQEVFFVLKATVTGVSHVTKDDVLTRQHTVTTDQITRVGADDVEKLLTAAAEALERARADADGQPALDGA
jgi:hypothetical protein